MQTCDGRLLGSVMVNAVSWLGRPRLPQCGFTSPVDGSGMMLLNEMNILTHGLSKADCAPWSGWASSDPWKA